VGSNDKKKSENGAGTVFMIIAAVCGLLGAGYYFFAHKKQEQKRPASGQVIDNSKYSGLGKQDTEIGSYQGPSLD